jgi:hypothetical protein
MTQGMTGKSGPAGESLLARLDRAHIGFDTCMGASVPSQGTRVTEGLIKELGTIPEHI